jgi:AraC-like DNA-binding protein
VVRTAAEFEQFFEVYPCNVFRNTVNDLAEQVVVLLCASARQGRGLPRQAQVARSLGLPLSTFRRRLGATGKSFQLLRDECLSERAQQLLARRDYSIAEIAAQLGYSDTASFRRAFRQWHGCAPAVWRQRVLRE